MAKGVRGWDRTAWFSVDDTPEIPKVMTEQNGNKPLARQYLFEESSETGLVTDYYDVRSQVEDGNERTHVVVVVMVGCTFDGNPGCGMRKK